MKTQLQKLEAEAIRTYWQDAFKLQARALQLPKSEPEYRFHADRLWRFDFAWPGWKISMEIDGGTKKRGRHVRHEGFQEDCVKLNTATAMGWRVYRFTSDHIKSGYAAKFMRGVLYGPGPSTNG